MARSDLQPEISATGEAGESQAEGTDTPTSRRRRERRTGSRISQGSVFYTRVLPVLILAMGIVTAALILFAAGVVLGIIPFR